MNFESWLAAKNIDAETLSPSARIALEAAWRAEQNPAPTPAPAPSVSVDKAVIDAEAEAARQRELGALAVEYIAKDPHNAAAYRALNDQAVAAKWDKSKLADKLELTFVRAGMSSTPNFYSPSKPAVDDAVVEAAFARASGISREHVEKSYSDQTLSAADKHFRSGVGIQRLLILGAQSNGYRDAGNGDWQRTLRAAFHDGFAHGNYNQLAAGPSTIQVSTILSNVANKHSVTAFEAVESVWRKIAATRPVNDFKQITGVALTGDLVYDEIANGGVLKNGTLGEETYTNQAKLWGKMLAISYQQIRNDDLSIFAKTNARLGRGGALRINKEFWTKFLATTFKTANGVANFWDAANGNYFAGTSVAMSLEGLGVAHEKWAKRTDPDGHPMGDSAKFLLVPTGYDLAARRYMRSTKISEDGGEGEENTLAGRWEPLSSTYLDNAAMGANASAVVYYLVADPNDLPVIEVVFLDGQEVPTVESADADFNQLGIQMRATHAFGVEKQEVRGGYKFKTTAD